MPRLRLIALLPLPVLVALIGIPAQPQPSVDLLIRAAHVVDGTGNPWYRGDVAIAGDTIVAMGPSLEATAARVIDADGLVVSPGFIDPHTHARRGIFDVPTAENYVRQGVTTLFEGQDGSSPLPLGAFLARVDETPISVNFASFVGHGSIRSEVIGPVDRAATPDEIEQMKAMVRRGMEDGAFGLSSGLFYVPGAFASTEEVIELAGVAGRMGGSYISHMRDEASGVLDSVRETIRIGEDGGLPTRSRTTKSSGNPPGAAASTRCGSWTRRAPAASTQPSTSIHTPPRARASGRRSGRSGPRKADARPSWLGSRIPTPEPGSGPRVRRSSATSAAVATLETCRSRGATGMMHSPVRHSPT